jgi:uncharacterized protein YndB with AHSA1/START domain
VLAAPAFTGAAPASAREFIHTRLVAGNREAVWRAWTDRSERVRWTAGSPFEGAIIESVEPVWLVFGGRTELDGGVSAMERASVTFVQLGDRTHVAVHSVVQFPAEPREADFRRLDSAWDERLDGLVDFASERER